MLLDKDVNGVVYRGILLGTLVPDNIRDEDDNAKPHHSMAVTDYQGLVQLTLCWDKNWDSHSLVNGYPSFYPRIALVAPSPAVKGRH